MIQKVFLWEKKENRTDQNRIFISLVKKDKNKLIKEKKEEEERKMGKKQSKRTYKYPNLSIKKKKQNYANILVTLKA